MMKLMIVFTVAAGVAGIASVAQAHRPAQGTVECPSTKDWAKCIWQEMDKNIGS